MIDYRNLTGNIGFLHRVCKLSSVFRVCFNNYFILFCSNLSNNKLKDIREGAFDGAGEVLELLLTGNRLTGIQGRMFRGLSGLKTL